MSPLIDIPTILIDTLRDRLIHRGPDAGHSWISSNRRLGLAHRRLSVVDLGYQSDQPLVSICGRYTIVFNGEIYNHGELRATLQAKGFKFKTSSDTEVILNAYAYWGKSCVSYFNGMFAFVIYDSVDGLLFVARDRFGEKPLFIGRGSCGVMILASEIKAIVAHPLVSDSINRSAIDLFSRGQWLEDDDETFFESVRRFPSRHCAYYSLDGELLEKYCYWDPLISDAPLDITVREAVNHFACLFSESIRLRLLADVPLGSSLSGGLDSTAITAFVCNQLPTPSSFSTFSAVFYDDPTISEHSEVSAVSESLNTNSYLVSPSAAGLQRESLLLHWHQEEPFLSASIYLQWCVARLAKENSITVLLDGQGADEMLGGYQFLFNRYQIDELSCSSSGRIYRDTRKYLRRLRAASSSYSQAHRRVNASICYSEDELGSLLLSPPSIDSAYSIPASLSGPGKSFRRSLYESLLYSSLPMLLRYADRNSMAFSREVRLPFLDHNLVEFCLNLPNHLLVRAGWQKYLLRQSLPSCVPQGIKWRRDKVGYAAPLDAWLRGPLKEWALERLMDSPNLSVSEAYDSSQVYSDFELHQSSHDSNLSWSLWKWISLSEWFDLHRSGIWRAGLDNSILALP